jgi:transposase
VTDACFPFARSRRVAIFTPSKKPFNNRHQVASYVGLTPSPFQSGPKCRDQGISKAGNPKARSTMIELAWLWLRHQPDSPLSIWFQARVGPL